MFNPTSEYYDFLKKNRVKCKCGHSILFVSSKKKVVCAWCGHYIYKDPKEQFKELLMLKKRRIENDS